jgi:hypothetical protein
MRDSLLWPLLHVSRLASWLGVSPELLEQCAQALETLKQVAAETME